MFADPVRAFVEARRPAGTPSCLDAVQHPLLDE